MSNFEWQGNLFDLEPYEDLSLEAPYIPEVLATPHCIERLGQLVLKVINEESENG